jgi:protein-S-isoprenylcysteine O-methyltransferase Ste14
MIYPILDIFYLSNLRIIHVIMNKLNFFGIGPKIAMVLLPWLAATIVLSCLHIDALTFTPEGSEVLFIAGIVLLFIGLVFYFSTVRMLLKGLRETRLVTTGTYSISQNPLYASLILLIIPALSLLLNSWLILTSSIAGYIMFRIYIRREYSELERFFGQRYLEYKKQTPEFFPFPVKKGGK